MDDIKKKIYVVIFLGILSMLKVFLIPFMCVYFHFRTALTSLDSYYQAGVVEFQPSKYQGSFLDQLNNNLREYITIITSKEAANLDIIVFPELTLNNLQQLTFVPDPEDNTIPCDNELFAPFLQDLSCVAKNTRKYVVVNLLEKELCTHLSQSLKDDPRPCSSNGLSQFNTNVALDRNGAVIARYRKFNSYDLYTNVTYRPELSTFETDFGVKFGMFICFDMNFYSPAEELVNSGVQNFIYSTFWYSELPFLTAVQLQQSWAYANNVNLLAAGASNPSGGTTGSGIYSGKLGALISVMSETPQRKLYTARVPKSPELSAPNAPKKEYLERRSIEGIALMREYRMNAFTSELLEPNDNLTVSKELCHNSFCCQFDVKIRRKSLEPGHSSYKYHLTVFDGDRQYSGFGYTKYKLCAVVACTDETLDSCGRTYDNKTKVGPEIVFEKITIEGDFPKNDKLLIMPNNVDQSLMPLSTDRFEFFSEEEILSYHVDYSLKTEADDLLTFGVYANYYK